MIFYYICIMDDICKIYTDGACSGNPGRGGIAAILTWKDKEKVISRGYQYTTNNRMELLSVIVALESLNRKNIEIEIYSDSKYVVDSVEKGWLFNWEKDKFRNRANADLWRRFLSLYNQFNITFFWVKGHASNEYNNRCDQLAVAAYGRENLDNLENDLAKPTK